MLFEKAKTRFTDGLDGEARPARRSIRTAVLLTVAVCSVGLGLPDWSGGREEAKLHSPSSLSLLLLGAVAGKEGAAPGLLDAAEMPKPAKTSTAAADCRCCCCCGGAGDAKDGNCDGGGD